MGAKEKDLDLVEELFYNKTKEKDWKWMLVPIPIAALKGPKKREEFVRVVVNSRVTLFHTDWTECGADARLLSEQGGINMVCVVTMKPAKTRMIATFANGNSVQMRETAQ
jgi:hypothetical protein